MGVQNWIAINPLSLIFSLWSFGSTSPSYFSWDQAAQSYLNLTMDGVEFKSQNTPFKTHSQDSQDLYVLDILKDKSRGFYVDLAANDYQSGSNTYIFDKYSEFEGVCVEPNLQYHANILSYRGCKLFVNPVGPISGEQVKFRMPKDTNGVFGGIVGEEYDNTEQSKSYDSLDYTCNTTTLTSILDFVSAPSVIDYLSLDIEGAEYHAMSKFAFDRYTFNVMTIERPEERLHFLLAENGYRFVAQLTHYGETLYVHRSFDRYEFAMKKYFDPSRVEYHWFNHDHIYLFYPKSGPGTIKEWNHENTSKYRKDALDLS